jgi:hypothetical protein
MFWRGYPSTGGQPRQGMVGWLRLRRNNIGLTPRRKPPSASRPESAERARLRLHIQRGDSVGSRPDGLALMREAITRDGDEWTWSSLSERLDSGWSSSKGGRMAPLADFNQREGRALVSSGLDEFVSKADWIRKDCLVASRHLNQPELPESACHAVAQIAR